MTVHTIFAIIYKEEIKNVCVGDYAVCNDIAHLRYGDQAFAIEVTQYPVEEGDKYIDGQFYHLGEDGKLTMVEYIPTDSQQIQALTAESQMRAVQISSLQEINSSLSTANEDMFNTLDSLLSELIPSMMGIEEEEDPEGEMEV